MCAARQAEGPRRNRPGVSTRRRHGQLYGAAPTWPAGLGAVCGASGRLARLAGEGGASAGCLVTLASQEERLLCIPERSHVCERSRDGLGALRAGEASGLQVSEAHVQVGFGIHKHTRARAPLGMYTYMKDVDGIKEIKKN